MPIRSGKSYEIETIKTATGYLDCEIYKDGTVRFDGGTLIQRLYEKGAETIADWVNDEAMISYSAKDFASVINEFKRELNGEIQAAERLLKEMQDAEKQLQRK